MKSTLASTALGLVVAMVAGGCTEHQTEMILVITTEGVRVPDDVLKLHLNVADREGSLDDTVYDADVQLCNPELSTSCYDIPVTAVLFPGKAHGGDSVRVQVDAIGPNGATVISDAALFTFADKQSLRLDFVLYANCLGNVECALRDQACGPLDQCIDLHPGHTSGPLDLALYNPADMSMPADMTLVDLAGADLTQVPPDLVSILDLAGCANVTCDMGEQCVAGVCQPCGLATEPCCFGSMSKPLPPNHPNAGGTGAGTCNSSNLECSGGMCVVCGNDTQLCCSMQTPSCNGSDVCINNTCQPLPPLDLFSPPFDMAKQQSMDMMTGPSLDMF
jgi:hypothetical protein